MAEAVLSIKHWGNNLGVRLPQAVAREANLQADQQVRVSVEEGRVVIEPLSTAAPLSLEERLSRFDPARHGTEAMVTSPLGAERW
jgi:antitoxin MazE